MKTMLGKIGVLTTVCICMGWASAEAQSLKELMKAKTSKDSSGSGFSKILTQVKKVPLTPSEAAEGLKQALEKGVEKGTNLLSATDGFLGNAAVKILMPPEAKKAEETLRKFGFGKQVDQAITSMNRAAEDAAKSAAPIFMQAIKNMTIQDAFDILKGNNDAATQYLKKQTTADITAAFRPVIDQSLTKVDATKYWNTVFSNYNRVASEKINPDLGAYVTEKALEGLFLQMAKEEANIRANPAARTTDLLKKVFSQ